MRAKHVLVAAILLASRAQAAAPPTTMTGTDCSQFLDAAEMASVKKPTPGVQARAVEAARDELIITMFWVHGYETGKTGKQPVLDQAWLQNRVTALGRICKQKGAEKMPISAAAAKL